MPSKFVYRFHQRDRVFHRRLLNHAVAEIEDEAAVAELQVPDMAKLQYVFDAVTSIRKALNGRVPLIGFSGSPWTLACYMVEGGGSDDYRLVKSLMYSRPDLMHRILAVNADAVALYLNTQIEAGAQAVMVFDSWGGVLADGAFQEFSLAYTRRVLAQLKTEHAGARIPRIVFTKGGGIWLDEIADSGCDVVGLDWTMNLGRARARVGLIAGLACVLGAGACTPLRSHQGYIIDKELVDSVQPGIDTRDTAGHR